MIPIKDHLMPQRCIGGVLDPGVEPLFSHHENLTIFQQDSAQFHATRQTNSLSMCNEWMLQPWPAYGPSLIQVEHLWDQICREAGSRLERPRARAQMIQSLQKEFKMIPGCAYVELSAVCVIAVTLSSTLVEVTPDIESVHSWKLASLTVISISRLGVDQLLSFYW